MSPFIYIYGRALTFVGAGFSAFCTISVIFFQNLCAKLRLDFFPKLWYNNSVKRGRASRSALARLPFDKGTDKIF